MYMMIIIIVIIGLLYNYIINEIEKQRGRLIMWMKFKVFIITILAFYEIETGIRLNIELEYGIENIGIGWEMKKWNIRMILLIEVISLFVLNYAKDYIKNESIALLKELTIFVLSMNFLVLSSDVINLWIGYEYLGLLSYKLIGINKKMAGERSSLYCYIINKIGDIGVWIGLNIYINQIGIKEWINIQ